MSADEAACPVPWDEQRIADVLRACRQSIHDAEVDLIAFGDFPRFGDALTRKCERFNRTRKWLDEMLADLPPPIPLTADQEAKVGAFIGAVLNKRFGGGGDEEVSAAFKAWQDTDGPL